MKCRKRMNLQLCYLFSTVYNFQFVLRNVSKSLNSNLLGDTDRSTVSDAWYPIQTMLPQKSKTKANIL